MFDHMIEEHNVIRRIAASLGELLVEDGMPIGRCLASNRWTLTRHLLRHFAMEKLLFSNHPAASHLTRVSPEPDPFERRYRQHVGDWSPDRIDNEWSRYCVELRAILRSLERRMDFEEREIYPALGRSAAALPAASA